MTIKKNKICVDDRIFTDSDLLSKYLLFGTLDEQKTYKVKAGDTIEQVAYNNKLSVEEFLIVILSFSNNFAKYKAVVSPSNVELVARIISLTSSHRWL